MQYKQALVDSLLAALLGQATGPTRAEGAPPPLKVGDVAPLWELAGSDGKTYRLEQILREKVAVLVWIPRAFTPS
ncbi:MAG: redoxin domain-containing protein [Armatimonadetes bacterium]|nr:redoxin domain-containing protein [Armatimonadota bacterium]MBM3947504.1 redoxin domain-containing protein [SAR202 cluster bacterium]